MTSFVIRLRNAEGQVGYVSRWQADESGKLGIIIAADRALAMKFNSEEAAEETISRMVLDAGLNRDESKIEEIAHDRTFSLVLKADDNGEPIDHISVVQEGEKRFIIVGDEGEEASEELPNEVAEILIRALGKLRKTSSR